MAAYGLSEAVLKVRTRMQYRHLVERCSYVRRGAGMPKARLCPCTLSAPVLFAIACANP